MRASWQPIDPNRFLRAHPSWKSDPVSGDYTRCQNAGVGAPTFTILSRFGVERLRQRRIKRSPLHTSDPVSSNPVRPSGDAEAIPVFPPSLRRRGTYSAETGISPYLAHGSPGEPPRGTAHRIKAKGYTLDHSRIRASEFPRLYHSPRPLPTANCPLPTSRPKTTRTPPRLRLHLGRRGVAL